MLYLITAGARQYACKHIDALRGRHLKATVKQSHLAEQSVIKGDIIGMSLSTHWLCCYYSACWHLIQYRQNLFFFFFGLPLACKDLIYLGNFSERKSLKRSVFGHEMKKCNTISTSFSVQNEHSLSSQGICTLTPTSSLNIHSSCSSGTVAGRRKRRRRPAQEHFNGNC